MRLLFNRFCRDPASMLDFYRGVLGGEEVAAHRTAIYRGLAVAGTELGFHLADAASKLMAVDDRVEPGLDRLAGYPSFLLDAIADVDRAAERAAALGGRVVKPPYASYYRQWQAMLEDPERQVFRVAAVGLPAGVEAPRLSIS